MKNKVLDKGIKHFAVIFIIFSIIMGSSSWNLWFGSPFQDSMNNPSLSANYLLKDKTYNMTLNDVYDDEDLDKLYTDAYFQSVCLSDDPDLIYNESVDSGVDNSYSNSPSNTGVSMINGTFDNSDNMKSNDDSYSTFEAEVNSSTLSNYLRPVGDISTGSWSTEQSPNFYDEVDESGSGDGKEIYTSTNLDSIYFHLTDFAGTTITSYEFWVKHRSLSGTEAIDIFVDYNDGGGYQYIGQESASSSQWDSITVNNVNKDGDQWNLRIRSVSPAPYMHLIDVLYLKVYYDVISSVIMNFTIDTDFSDMNEDLLAINVSSFHYTNVSQTIVGRIYNYTSDSYVQMFSSSNTAETENNFLSESSIDDYLNGTGNIRLKFSGDGSVDFKLLIDYIRIRFIHKMNLWHEATFNMSGSWRYRWEIHGSLQYTDWTYFEVVDPDPNFHAISESEFTTRWILQGSEISASEDFHDDLDSGTWNLILNDNDTTIDTNQITEGDAYVWDHNPDTNYGTGTAITIAYWLPENWESSGFIKWAYPYLDLNYTSNSTFSFFNTAGTSPTVLVYHTSSFGETTVTWNNQPATGTFQKDWGIIPYGWNEMDLGSPNFYYKFLTNKSIERYCGINSREKAGNEPRIRHHFSKIFHGSGYMYMQTDESESIALKCEDYGTHYTLSSGDYFEVDFQTNSDSQINLILLKDGVVNKTIILSQSGNTNFNRRTVQVSVDEDVEFDQLKISSTFEDTDNVKVYDIKTYKYTITGDYEDFYISPINQRDVYLTPDTYNLRIFEEGIKKADINITIGSTDYYYVYEPIETIESRITLFSLDGDYLQFEDYHIKVNRSLNGEYAEFWLVDTIFYTDEETYAYIEVYDRFDALIDTFSKLVSNYIDLELEVYQLQIKSLMEKETTLDINSTHIYPLLSGDSLYFMLVKDNYEVGYYDENDNYNQFMVYLDSNKAYELNTSYFDVYFSVFNFDGLGLDHDLFRFYINNQRKDFGFNTLTQDTNNLRVLDYFNATLYNGDINLRSYTEFNINVEVYTLILYNNYSHPVKFELERNNIEIEQIIPSASGLSYRFLPNVEYLFRIYYLNGTLIEEREIDLDQNNKIISFGFFDVEFPDSPELINYDAYFWAFIGVSIAIIIIIVLFARFKIKYARIPERTKNAYKKDRKSNNYSEDKGKIWRD